MFAFTGSYSIGTLFSSARVGIVQHGPRSTLGLAYSRVDPRVGFFPCILLELSIRVDPGVGLRFFTFIGDRAKGGWLYLGSNSEILFGNNKFHCFVIKTC